MALKKRIPVKPAQTTSEANTQTASKRTIAPPKRVIPPPAKRSAPIAQEAPIPPVAPKKTRPVRKPVVKTPAPAKEVKPVEQAPKVEPPIEREEGKSPEAPKPAVTAGSDREESGHRPAPRGEESKRISTEAMRSMELEDRYRLFKKLNRDPEAFVPIRYELPKKMQMRKDEALIRKIISERAPRLKGSDFVGYCCYCVDWQVYYNWTWMGSTKCIGCGMSTRDFYNGIDNGIFGKG